MEIPKVWGNPGRALELFFELSPRDQHSGGAGARTGCLPGVEQPVMSVLVKRSAEHLDLDEDETIDATPVDANGNAQRARTGSRHHPSEYKPGAVMKVRLHNFMTYSDVEMEPGPRLNVILGPNGTGKSSFVCALAMGLAAPTKILGRADKVAEYVKRGEEKGWCEITLRGERPDKPLVVRREMSRSAGSGRYLINGYPVGVERVKAEIKKLGCQLDNLCQFLPQDRVVAFAQLKPTELLLETEKAIGDGHLFNEHEWLINEKKAIADLEREVSARRKTRVARISKCWHPPRRLPLIRPRPSTLSESDPRIPPVIDRNTRWPRRRLASRS